MLNDIDIQRLKAIGVEVKNAELICYAQKNAKNFLFQVHFEDINKVSLIKSKNRAWSLKQILGWSAGWSQDDYVHADAIYLLSIGLKNGEIKQMERSNIDLIGLHKTVNRLNECFDESN